jgi:hypothetical protein
VAGVQGAEPAHPEFESCAKRGLIRGAIRAEKARRVLRFYLRTYGQGRDYSPIDNIFFYIFYLHFATATIYLTYIIRAFFTS